MKRFLIFVFAMFAIGTAYGDEYTVLCPSGYRVNGDSCEICPAGTFSRGGNVTECTLCPNGTYSGLFGTNICTPCPSAAYPNTEPGATSPDECFSDVKYRSYDGTVECREISNECTTAKCVCENEPEPCEYVAYAKESRQGFKIVYIDGEIKSGCAANPCISDVIDYATLYGGVYDSESNKCELCTPGTYYTKDKKTGAAECIACPDGTTSVAGAVDSSQCIAAVCDAGYYLNGAICTKCPDTRPNSEPGATSLNECYSDVKYREWTGEQITPDVSDACTDAVFGECQIDACEYVKYYYGALKSGCATNNENCEKPILTATANPGYIFNGTTCEKCPAGAYSTGTECIQCPANTYSFAGATECTSCPDGYPHSEPGSTSRASCYSDEKLRPWTGHQVCDSPVGCINAICMPCEIKPCKYVAYCNRFIVQDGATKSGCSTNDANCSAPASIVSALPGYRVNGTMCEVCPENTYSTGGENAKCEPCPSGAVSFAGAKDRAECMRILNYQDPNAAAPTKIYLSGYKNTSPALAVGIGDDVFYANMTPIEQPVYGKMHIGYNDKIYSISSNVYKNDFRTDAFYITTTPDTDSFGFNIIANGDFTIDWDDGNVESVHTTASQQTLSHTYDTPGEYTIELRGYATYYRSYKSGFKTLYKTIEFTDKLNILGIGGSLGAIFPTLDDGTNPNFHGLFSGAVNLTGTIPDNLFRGITGSPADSVYSSMFNSVFSGCSGLTGRIPVGLFGNLSGDVGSATFTNAFYGCSGLSGPAARNPDGTPLYDIEYNGQIWLEYAPGAFTDMYTDSGISDL